MRPVSTRMVAIPPSERTNPKSEMTQTETPRSLPVALGVHKKMLAKVLRTDSRALCLTLPVVSDIDFPAVTISYLVVPWHPRSTLGRRAFSVAGPMAWNALPDDLRDPSLSADNFRKTHLFRNALALSALDALRNMLYKFKTYLLTYCHQFYDGCNLLPIVLLSCKSLQTLLHH